MDDGNAECVRLLPERELGGAMRTTPKPEKNLWGVLFVCLATLAFTAHGTYTLWRAANAEYDTLGNLEFIRERPRPEWAYDSVTTMKLRRMEPVTFDDLGPLCVKADGRVGRCEDVVSYDGVCVCE